MRRWTEEDKQAFYELLRTHYLEEAIRIYSRISGRSYHSISNWFYYSRSKGKIPQSVLDSRAPYIKKWSEEETKDLLQTVAEHPNNFSEAFRLHAEQYERSVSAVQLFFANYRKEEDAKICAMTIGRKKRCSPNRKNIYPGTGGTIERTKVSKWKRILKILFE